MIREHKLLKTSKLSAAVQAFRLKRQKKNAKRRKKVSLYRLKTRGFNFVWASYLAKRIKIAFLKKNTSFYFYETLSLQPQLFFKNAVKFFFNLTLTNFFFYNFFFYGNLQNTHNFLFLFNKLIFLIKHKYSLFFLKIFFLKIFFLKLKKILKLLDK